MSAALRAYCPYGHYQNQASPASVLGFNGERHDPLTGTYALGVGYRSYSPVLMRFQAPDNLSPFGKGGLNIYAYCAGDPVNYLDESGHFRNPAQRRARSTSMALETPTATPEKYRSATGAKDINPQMAPVKNEAHTPKRTVIINEITVKHRYGEGDSQFKRERYLERKRLIKEMGRAYWIFEIHQQELNNLHQPSARDKFMASNNGRLYQSWITHHETQLVYTHRRLTEFYMKLKSIR